jgi:predicted ATPase
MKYFIDNFRGFNNLTIDLDRVNFLVGENSTGKTSLISALTLISDYRFWSSGEIISEHIDYSTFDDLHSVNSTRDFFTLGIIDDDDNENSIHLLSFKDNNGLPIVFREIVTSIGNSILVIEHSHDKITYKTIPSMNVDFKESVSQILDYVDSPKSKKITQKQLKNKTHRFGRPSFRLYRYLLFEQDKKVYENFQNIRNFNMFFNVNVSYLAPIRAKPLPLYSGAKQSFTPEGGHTPFLIKEAISIKNAASDIVDALRDFGKESGLFDDLSAFTYGDKKISPFELLVRKNRSSYKISSVGYGVSQVLPIVTELILNNETNLITIQQPEVHLHPKAQAAFGSFIYKMALRIKKRKLIIETHSDYVIDRFRYQQKEMRKNISSKVLFFQNDGKNNTISTIKIGEDGKYPLLDCMANFRSFFIDESFKLMEI